MAWEGGKKVGVRRRGGADKRNAVSEQRVEGYRTTDRGVDGGGRGVSRSHFDSDCITLT